MDCTGIIRNISLTFGKVKYILELEINEDISQQYEQLKNEDKLSICIKKYRAKRSLDANAYFHLLNSKIADKLHISQNRSKNVLLNRYGQLEYKDDKIPTVLIKSVYDEDMEERSDIHFKAVGYEIVNDESYTKYAIIRGTHTYDTKEMATLIDGTVDEAKNMGIETITPTELKEMKERWGV